MKSELMERAKNTGGLPPPGNLRRAIAVGFALFIHGLFFFIFTYVPEKPLTLPSVPISVKLVIESPSSPETPATPKTTRMASEIKPLPKPLETLKADHVALAAPSTDPQPDPLQHENRMEPSTPAPPVTAPLSILSSTDSQSGEPIPDRWRLPIGARIPLEETRQSQNPDFEALTKSLDCFGFDADCAVQRKVIFKEDQLTNTDLVWMRSYAHSGLSNSDFYGMSEAQIRERLGIPTAGQNGLTLLPGIVIDGTWWDALHGVNKACDYGLGINDLGQKQLIKSCAPLKPSSKDRIGFMPKPVD